MGFFLSELQHFLITLLIAIFVFLNFRSLKLILICFLFGFFIDVDHLIDYFIYSGFKFNFLDFTNVEAYMLPAGKIYVVFHAWEFIFLFFFLARLLAGKLKLKGLEWAVSLPYLAHLLVDHFSFKHNPLAYSLLYRIINNFSLKAFDCV